MRKGFSAFLGLALLASLPTAGRAATSWRLVLPDSVRVQGSRVLLRDLSLRPVPAAAGALVLQAGAAPNTTVSISRRTILRQLVTAGLSGGVTFGGAESCCVAFAGRELDSDTLAGAIRARLQLLVPPPDAGAPDSWFELDYPSRRLSADGAWKVRLGRHDPLAPGRNLVQVHIEAGMHRERFAATVILHSFGETAQALRALERDRPLSEDQFTWQWRDLAEVARGVVVGRARLAGTSTARRVQAGDPLREADLVETPVIRAGDPVELRVVRGHVAVTVRAFARQKGCLHQTIPVRNELTGRLVNARIAGPGLVEWRR